MCILQLLITVAPLSSLSLSLQVWINQGDIILIGLRDYQDAKADVILRYNPDEARNLKTYGELPETGLYCVKYQMMLTVMVEACDSFHRLNRIFSIGDCDHRRL